MATAVDLVDEDAADLQFPKDYVMANVSEYDERSADTCYVCGMWLREPYISCYECSNIYICTKCFACGGERPPHASYHSYSVIRNEFPLMGGWMAKEELTLLEAMIESGAGNWTDVAKKMGTRTEEECIKHYFNSYIENTDLQLQMGEVFSQHKVEVLQQTPLTPYNRYVSQFKKSTEFDSPEDHIPPDKNVEQRKAKISSFYRQQQLQIQRMDPSRPFFECRATQFIPGYNAARGEFAVEFDDSAELMVADLDDEVLDSEESDTKLLAEMQVAIVGAYNERLKERKRRKQIIRRHGLLLLQKTIGWLQRFETTIGKEVAEKMVCLMRVTSGKKFDYFLESLHAIGELRTKIVQLKEMRSKGITNYRAWQIYRRLTELRSHSRKDWPNLDASSAMLGIGNVSHVPVHTSAPRKQPPPLDIMALPGYEKLTPAERDLCSTLRLAPLSFLDFRDILVTESRRHPGSSLKLAQARTLIKIDVNKTRKLYDFLLNEGYFTQGA